MRKYDVICPFCSGVFLETNEHFDSNRPANGSMFTAKKQIIEAGWSTFPLCDSSEYANVVCPSCDQTLLDSAGRVIILKDVGEIPDKPASKETMKAVEVDMTPIIEKMMAEYEPELPKAVKKKPGRPKK